MTIGTTTMAAPFTEPAPTAAALLLLGRGTDLRSERGVECPGALPAPSDPDLLERARAAREALGERAFVLGHHYQRDEVIQLADVTGDSFKLAREATARPEAEFVVFCGGHFMAESADILTAESQQVVLPDLAAGCSTADMAAISQVEDAWDVLTDAGVADDVVPVTYMNSSAAIKSFTGRHGGHGLHVVERGDRAGLGVLPAWRRLARGPTASCCSCPTSTSAATPRCASSASALDAAEPGSSWGRAPSST